MGFENAFTVRTNETKTYVTLREERKYQVLEEEVLSKAFGPERDKQVGILGCARKI